MRGIKPLQSTDTAAYPLKSLFLNFSKPFMTILRFKTNINCAGCVAKVTPYLDKEESINNWQVDTTGKEKILRVSGQEVNPQRVKQVVQDAGFKAELIQE